MTVNILQQNDYAPFPLFLAAALFILASPIFWMGVEAPGQDRPDIVTENADLYIEIAPVMQYGFGRVRQGALPLWNDRQLCGVPFFANPVHGLLQPLNLGFLFLDTPRALALHAFLALSFMGFFFVVFMRALGVLYVPAALGGIVYMCCGATAAAMSRPGIANALVWMPLLCWALRSHARAPRSCFVLAGGVILALLLLSGSPVMVLVVAGFCCAYGCALALFGVDANDSPDQESSRTGPPSFTAFRQGHKARFGGLLLMLVIALALTCAQWLPTLAWMLTLDAPGAYLGRFAVAGVMPQGILALGAQLLLARSGPLPALGYVGVSTLLLLPAAFFHPVPRWERAFLCLSTVALWIGAALFGGGLSTGVWAALVYPASFAVAVLTALGADRLFAPRRNTLTPRLWGPPVLVLAVFIIVFVLAPAPTRGRMAPLAVSLALFALFRTRWASALSGMILIAFLFVDLSAASVNHYGHPFFSNAAALPLPAETTALIHNTSLDDRVMISAPPVNARIHGNIGMSEGFRVAGGVGYPLTPEQAVWWRALRGDDPTAPLDVSADAAQALLLNVMAARAVAAVEGGGLNSGSAPGLRLRRQGAHDNVTVYANETAVPRLSWAPSWRIALDLPSALDALSDPSFDPRRECVVLPSEPAISHLARTVPDSRAARERQTPPEPAGTRIYTLLDTPERLIIEVENAAPGVLVVSDTFASGWRAHVNGQRVPILKTNGLFRGIALPSGTHTVTFTYIPFPLIAGAAVSIVTLCLMLLIALALRLRH